MTFGGFSVLFLSSSHCSTTSSACLLIELRVKARILVPPLSGALTPTLRTRHLSQSACSRWRIRPQCRSTWASFKVFSCRGSCAPDLHVRVVGDGDELIRPGALSRSQTPWPLVHEEDAATVCADQCRCMRGHREHERLGVQVMCERLHHVQQRLGSPPPLPLKLAALARSLVTMAAR